VLSFAAEPVVVDVLWERGVPKPKGRPSLGGRGVKECGILEAWCKVRAAVSLMARAMAS